MARSVRTVLRSFTVVTALCAGLATVPTASADPSPRTVEAKRELQRINREVALAAEHYNGARIALQAARRDAARAQARVAAKQQAVDEAAAGVGQLAAAAYMTGGTDPFIHLLSDATPATFIDKAASLDAVARRQSERVRHLVAARRALRHDQSLAADKLATADRITADLERTKQDIERKLARQQSLVRQLESDDARRERLEREAAERRAAQLAAARERAARLAAAENARKAALSRAQRTRSGPVYSGPAEGRAAIAVQEAYRQLGKPYQWGAEGPDSFDCSGLSKWAWAKAGVSLPHYSRAQYNEGRHVSQAELRPGDLVFFGDPIHHLGIYVGNGNMIHAPQTGDVVKVSSAFRDDYTGAVRL